MIVVCDVNTIWRHRPFAALAGLTDVLGVSPCDPRTAHKIKLPKETALKTLRVVLPPSWATRSAWLGQRMLWRRMRHAAKKEGQSITCVVITSPHYLTLLNLIPPTVKTVYYASDDYRNYDGWSNMAEQEKTMVQRVNHSFFISEGLAERARSEYGVAASAISVSMNGTEERFFRAPNETLPMEPPLPNLVRPLVGVVGGINDRLDFSLLQQCADVPGVGTLLLVGPLPESPGTKLTELLNHPKCVSVGAQPHETIHEWFKCLDVGLIPYTKSVFNSFCSPMRLFDHLATGLPIVATDACDQVAQFPEQVAVCQDGAAFVGSLNRCLSSKEETYKATPAKGIRWQQRARQLLDVIEEDSFD